MSAISELFDNIAPKYDSLNHILSLNIDKRWRRNSLQGHISFHMDQVLDVACGTGDFAIQLTQCGVKNVIGIDVSEKMLEVCQQKVSRLNLGDKITLQKGDCAMLPFADNQFDAVTVAFGVRNFGQRAQSLREIHRVLKPKAPLIILELSQPKYFPIKQLYRFYFKRILPFIGGKISGDTPAYQYLPNSVYAFPQGEAFLNELKDCGFTELSQKRYSFGIASAYYATK